MSAYVADCLRAIAGRVRASGFGFLDETVDAPLKQELPLLASYTETEEAVEEKKECRRCETTNYMTQ